MKLTGPEREELREILLEIFDRDGLTRALGEANHARDFEHLVPPGPFENQVFKLIRRAEREGWLDELPPLLEKHRRDPDDDLLQRARAIIPEPRPGSGALTVREARRPAYAREEIQPEEILTTQDVQSIEMEPKPGTSPEDDGGRQEKRPVNQPTEQETKTVDDPGDAGAADRHEQPTVLQSAESESKPAEDIEDADASDHDEEQQAIRTPEPDENPVRIVRDAGAPDRGEEPKTIQSSEPERFHEKDRSVLVHVPGGRYALGAEDISVEAGPVHQVSLSSFWISKCCVDNEQYRRFLEAHPGHIEPRFWNDPAFNQPDQPVVGVSWAEAVAYCRWAGLELPSEAQWEAAARGIDQRPFPWGEAAPTADRANFQNALLRTASVDTYPGGAGPFGTLNQAGNVWEWCQDAWVPNAYLGRDGKHDPLERDSWPRKTWTHLGRILTARIGSRGTEGVRARNSAAVGSYVIRGGAWSYPVGALGSAVRNWSKPEVRASDQGFRCVLVDRDSTG